jgi:hypothetical protein
VRYLHALELARVGDFEEHEPAVVEDALRAQLGGFQLDWPERFDGIDIQLRMSVLICAEDVAELLTAVIFMAR